MVVVEMSNLAEHDTNVNTASDFDKSQQKYIFKP